MNFIGLLLLLWLSGFGPGDGLRASTCSYATQWREVIAAHALRYPGMGAADLYKLLHQGAMGSEHAVQSVDAARRWMDSEVASMGDGPPEPLVDTIAPSGSHVRVHLRPFVEQGGDPVALLSAFVRTANAGTGSEEALTCALEAARMMAGERLLPWDEAELSDYFGDRRSEGYPAVHHSESFEAQYRPAYRVVAAEFIDEALGIAR